MQSVTQTGWRTSKDGPLLSFAQERFDVFVTVDRRLEQQNELGELKPGFIVVRVPHNRLEAFEPVFEQLKLAAETVGQGEVVYVVSPDLKGL